jgi:hypothetical protein
MAGTVSALVDAVSASGTRPRRPRPAAVRYDWDRWCDGGIHLAEAHIDFWVGAKSFGDVLAMHAKRHGLKLAFWRSFTIEDDEQMARDCVLFKFVPPAWARS